MRTVHSSGHPEGGSQHALGRGVCIPACTGQEGVFAQGGGVSAPVHSGIHTPLWTEWQMLVKILPCRNYVADGKNANFVYYLKS